MRKTLKVFVAFGILLFSNTCSEAPKGTKEQALELARPLVESYARNWEIPVDSLKSTYEILFSEDSSNATIFYFHRGHFEFGIYVDFKKDSATFVVY